MIRLRDLDDCFEGVIPSIIATVAADGTPNISYLSHVVLVDDAHVAISNQFLAKTAANMRANPQASLLLVSARDGGQYRLDVTWVTSRDEGELFDRVSDQLRASSAQVGLAGVMRLKAVDIFQVNAIVAVASPVETIDTSDVPSTLDLTVLGRAMSAISAQSGTEQALGALLDGCEDLGFSQVVVLLGDNVRRLLTTVASRGYDRSGIGSEIAFDDGLIGIAAGSKRPVKINDMSRVLRMGAAIEATSDSDEDRTRTIVLPSLPDAISQIAMPLLAQGTLRGVLFVESRDRLAFTTTHETALEMMANQCALALALCEALAPEAEPVAASAAHQQRGNRAIQISHHTYDDSVFIDNAYVIKGVAGRLLAYMLDAYISEGRRDFTNREIRLAETLRLPDIKDNLETRLLLLRRRLDEKNLPVRLIHAGRGQVTLAIDGMPVFSHTG
ncbi:GAF domain-containing protein [Dyella silvae]|uniref:pyridoxamine 5'-phosphate oxidase family protein n=1 Tax=Dyella silvae TaxID=2994424 RepID=UPI002263C1DD|nr:GAF domain-containing protein [Dyella silvae]